MYKVVVSLKILNKIIIKPMNKRTVNITTNPDQQIRIMRANEIVHTNKRNWIRDFQYNLVNTGIHVPCIKQLHTLVIPNSTMPVKGYST